MTVTVTEYDKFLVKHNQLYRTPEVVSVSVFVYNQISYFCNQRNMKVVQHTVLDSSKDKCYIQQVFKDDLVLNQQALRAFSR